MSEIRTEMEVKEGISMKVRKKSTPNPEVVQQRREKKRLEYKQKKETRSQEEKEKRLEKERKRWAAWTPERKKMKQERDVARRKKQREENEEYRQKQNAENVKRRRAKVETESLADHEKRKAAARKKMQERRARETPTETAERLKRDRERRQRVKMENPEKWSNMQERARFYEILKTVMMTEEQLEEKKERRYFGRQAAKYRCKSSYENLSQERKKKQVERNTKWRHKLTEEKKRRYLDSVYRSKKRRNEKRRKDPVAFEKWKKKHREYQRKRYAKETPQQRLRRRRKDSITGARMRLKRKLEAKDVPMEQIEEEMEKLEDKMWDGYYPDGDIPPRRPKKKPPPPPPPPQPPPTNNETATVDVVIERNTVIPVFTLELDDLPVSTDEYTTFYYLTFPEGFEIISEEVFQAFLPSMQSSSASPSSSLVVPPPTVPPPTEPPDPGVKCAHCPFFFPTDLDLHAHIRSVHVEKCWRCPKCLAAMVSPSELSEHFQTAHKSSLPPASSSPPSNLPPPPSNFTCMKCTRSTPTRFPTRQLLFAHVQSQHASYFWPCVKCHLLKYSQHSLLLHRQICRRYR